MLIYKTLGCTCQAKCQGQVRALVSVMELPFIVSPLSLTISSPHITQLHRFQWLIPSNTSALHAITKHHDYQTLHLFVRPIHGLRMCRPYYTHTHSEAFSLPFQCTLHSRPIWLVPGSAGHIESNWRPNHV